MIMKTSFFFIPIIWIILLFSSCDKDNANQISSGDANVTFPLSSTYVDHQSGNINFKCLVTNVSSTQNPDLKAHANYYYSPSGIQSTYQYYGQQTGIIQAASPNVTSHDDMKFPTINQCCNKCCPGYYMCVLTLYAPDNTTIVTTATREVEVFSSGAINIKQ